MDNNSAWIGDYQWNKDTCVGMRRISRAVMRGLTFKAAFIDLFCPQVAVTMNKTPTWLRGAARSSTFLHQRVSSLLTWCRAGCVQCCNLQPVLFAAAGEARKRRWTQGQFAPLSITLNPDWSVETRDPDGGKTRSWLTRFTSYLKENSFTAQTQWDTSHVFGLKSGALPGLSSTGEMEINRL